MKIIKLNEGDLIRIIKKMIHEQPQEPLDPETSNESQTTEWYYQDKGSARGPFDIEYIEMLIERETIFEDTLVWKNGMPRWVKAITVAELKPVFDNLDQDMDIEPEEPEIGTWIEPGDQDMEPETPDQRKERKQHIYTTKQHIVQMGISIMNDIEEIRSFRNEIESANYHPEDKEELVGLCNYTISLIHNDTFPPTKTSPHDEDDYDY